MPQLVHTGPAHQRGNAPNPTAAPPANIALLQTSPHSRNTITPTPTATPTLTATSRNNTPGGTVALQTPFGRLPPDSSTASTQNNFKDASTQTDSQEAFARGCEYGRNVCNPLLKTAIY
jgi:hypothetical protein